MPSSAGVTNIRIGSCSVTFGTADLGLTKGGVEVEITTETHKTTVDQFGPTIVKETVMGRNIKIVTPLAEATLATLKRITPGSRYVESTAAATKKRVEVSPDTGLDLLANAAKLVLHPMAKLATDKNDDIVVPKAAPTGELQFAFKEDDEMIWKVTFMGYPTGADNDLFYFGDESFTDEKTATLT